MIEHSSQAALDENQDPIGTQQKTLVSIVVPCFNEIEAIPNLAEHLADAKFELERFDLEFIFVDDGSTDETQEVLCDHFASWENATIVRHQTNRGLMAAIMTGAKMSKGSIICSIDSDCTYNPSGLVDLIPELSEGVGMVTGSPYHPDGAILNVPKWRIWISYSASWMYRMILKSRLYCFTSSFRAYRREAISGLELSNGGFVGTTEILWRIEQRGWKIKEVPSVLSVREFGQSKIRIFQVTLDHLNMMKKILLSRFTKSPEKTSNDDVAYSQNES